MTRERLTMRLAATADASEKKNEKKRESSGEMRRNLEGFNYDTSKATTLKKALHNLNVSLGTLLSAMKDLSLLRGSEITPDGMIGGRGFIMPFKDIKSKIASSIDDLSNITDSIADELTNPKWGLSSDEKKKVKDEKEEIQEEIEEVEEEIPELSVGNPDEPPKQDPLMNIVAPPEEHPIGEEEGIGPMDVIDSSEIATLKRYRDLIEGNVTDKIASILGKDIMANLLKGDK